MLLTLNEHKLFPESSSISSDVKLLNELPANNKKNDHLSIWDIPSICFLSFYSTVLQDRIQISIFAGLPSVSWSGVAQNVQQACVP